MTCFSVLIASHNGASRLSRVLEGYANQAATPGSMGAAAWDIVIVDNASTDATSEVIEGFCGRLPVKLVRHGVPGKNGALIAGLSHVDGDTIILSDDDAIPEPDFISSWVEGVRAQPNAALFGGTVVPLFDAPVPEWLDTARDHFDALYAVRGPLDGAIPAQQIFGPNMAVRRCVFDAGVTFDERIGPNAADKLYAMGSETDFSVRAERAGFKAWSLAAPTVRHIVRREQMTWAFFNERAFRLGRGIAVRQWMSGELVPRAKPSLIKLAAAHAIQTGREAVSAFACAAPRLSKRVEAAWQTQWLRGFHREYRRLKSQWRSEASFDGGEPVSPRVQS